MFAAIDVGSNAMRLAIGSLNGRRKPELVENIRDPVRLGHDVFTRGVISEDTTRRTLEAFQRFRQLMDRHGVQYWRAVATSAMREARNRDVVIERIAHASGIDVAVIGAEEEARLVHLAVASQIPLRGKVALLIDIGGGSVEITITVNGRIVATDSFRMGAVRLLQELAQPKEKERRFNPLVREYVDATRKRLKKEIGRKRIDLCVGTGGNVESLGDLRERLFQKDGGSMKIEELGEIIEELQTRSVEERARAYGLRPDRADVILPAAIVLHKVVKQARTGRVLIPRVGLKDGLLIDLIQDLQHENVRSHREQAIASALQLGRKFNFDEQHALATARFATQLFRDLRSSHGLAADHGLLLEVAALVHDIGNFVGVTGHHKHSFYLVNASPLIGLTEEDRAIVANVARYHRKSAPSLNHEPYRALAPRDRLVVSKLAALLRIADALDREHGDKVRRVRVARRRSNLTIHLKGRGDLLLERWAVGAKAALFEEVFGMKVTVAESTQ